MWKIEVIIPWDFFKFATCQMKGLFVEADLGGNLIGASGERAHLPSAISPATASATVERWTTFSKLRTR
jgi:hypothetical protein